MTLNLLFAALSLISALMANPDLGGQYRQDIYNIAFEAVDKAKAELAGNLGSISTGTPAQNSGTIIPTVTYEVTTPIIPVEKALTITLGEYHKSPYGFAYYDVFVYYTEDGKYKKDVEVTLTADDGGDVTANGPRSGDNNGLNKPQTTINLASFNLEGIGAPFVYRPKETGDRVLTATANGVQTTIISRGNVE